MPSAIKRRATAIESMPEHARRGITNLEKFTPAAEYPKPCRHPKGRLHHWCWYLVYYYPWRRRP